MMKLIGTDGSRYFAFELEPGKHTLGRREECDFYVPDKTISRAHAEVEVLDNGGGYYIHDLGSHNGTMVNGERISERTKITPGDVITFGRAEFKLATEEDEHATRSRPTATKLSDVSPDKSVYLSIDEALKPLPKKVTERPELFPVLSEMARMLVLDEPEETMLERSLELVSRVLPADRLAILYCDEEEDEIYTKATLLQAGSDPGGKFELSKTIVNDILTDKRAVLVGDPQSDERYAQQQSIIASELKSAMAVPLFDEGKVLGILYTDTGNPMHQYTDEHLRLLATFGNIIASRLLNYSLVQERQEKQIIENELKRASLIQQKLLVDAYPPCDTYKMHAIQNQCRAVGGDLYDATCLRDGQLLFLVGDVSGKGMGAALLMSNILASFRILYESREFDLARAVARVSRQLFLFSNPGDFATLFVGLVDPETNKLSYINAGHNPPILLHSDGSIDLLEPCGFMIGAFEAGEWPPKEVEVKQDDVVIVFTDGVTEAESENGQYGEERLEAVVKGLVGKEPDEVGKGLMEDIQKFTGETPQSDDVTMLIVKRSS